MLEQGFKIEKLKPAVQSWAGFNQLTHLTVLS